MRERMMGLAAAVVAAVLALAGTAKGLDWTVETIDGVGSCGLHSWVTLDSAGRPNVAYLNRSTNDLLYVSRDGAAWQRQVVDPGDCQGVHAVSLDSAGRPHIFYEGYVFGSQAPKYASWNGSAWDTHVLSVGRQGDMAIAPDDRPCFSVSDGGKLAYGVWNGTSMTKQTVDASCSPISSSLAFDSQGRPHIAYYAATGSQYQVRCASWDGAAWNVSVVEGMGSSVSGQQTLSLAIDSQDRACISYQDSGAQVVRYAHWNGSAWMKETVDPTWKTGFFTSLELDPGGRPCIAYSQYLNSSSEPLRYAAWNGTAWDIQVVHAPDSGFASLAMDSAGRAYIAFYDENEHLAVASAVPEPAALSLLAAGGMAALRRRRSPEPVCPEPIEGAEGRK